MTMAETSRSGPLNYCRKSVSDIHDQCVIVCSQTILLLQVLLLLQMKLFDCHNLLLHLRFHNKLRSYMLFTSLADLMQLTTTQDLQTPASRADLAHC